jgi:hypothetical protein
MPILSELEQVWEPLQRPIAAVAQQSIRAM